MYSTKIKRGELPVWYKRWEVWGAMLLALFSAASVIMLMFPEIQLVYRLGGIIGVILGLINTFIGIIKGYKHNNLPEVITSILDKSPTVYKMKGMNLK